MFALPWSLNMLFLCSFNKIFSYVLLLFKYWISLHCIYNVSSKRRKGKTIQAQFYHRHAKNNLENHCGRLNGLIKKYASVDELSYKQTGWQTHPLTSRDATRSLPVQFKWHNQEMYMFCWTLIQEDRVANTSFHFSRCNTISACSITGAIVGMQFGNVAVIPASILGL